MDQSLLLGIHTGDESTDPSKLKDAKPISLPMLNGPLQLDPHRKPASDLQSIFQTVENALRGFNDEKGKPITPRKEIYFMGIIDILQEFNVKKQIESTVKGIRFNRNAISAVSSRRYAERFMKYLFDHMV